MSRKNRKFTETGLPWHIVEEAVNLRSAQEKGPI